MVNYACGFNQSEMGKYFERIIIMTIISRRLSLNLSRIIGLFPVTFADVLNYSDQVFTNNTYFAL